jgi:hypothetical protein
MIIKIEPKAIIEAEKSIKHYFAKMFPDTHSEEILKQKLKPNYYLKQKLRKVKP